MSGIFGIFQRNNQPASRENLAYMAERMAEFGTQGGGLWLNGPIGLGQRLMVITPQDRFERQPLAGGPDTLILVSDGRIDNRTELLVEMGLPATPAEIPDGELILRAYQKWGRDCLGHLVGVFAFAIWDAREMQLFAARSPIMAPALVYFASSTVFAFATMPRGLHALPFVPRVLNERKIASFLTLSGSEPQATFYQDVLRLPTGHWLAVDASKLQTGCYWQPDLSHTLRFADETECLQALQGVFERVMSDALRSATPSAMLLSGGLDSASVAAQGAQLLAREGGKLITFTEAPREGFAGAVLKGRYADESGLVRVLASRYPELEVNIVRTPGGFYMDDLEPMFSYLEAPFRNTSNWVWIEAILREAGQRGLRTVLDGGQGNLTISWNGSGLLPELLLGGQWRQAWYQAGGAGYGRLAGFFIQGLLPCLPAPVWDTLKWFQHPRVAFTPSWLARTVLNPGFVAELRLAEQFSEQDLALQSRDATDTRRLRYNALSHQDSGMYYSAYQAMFGIVKRSPLADVRLVEFCLALPEAAFRWNGEPRRLIRRLMADRLPPEVLSNRRRGLQAADWFERLHAARPRVAETLARLDHSSLAPRILDLKRMRRMFENMPAVNEPDFEKIADYRFVFEPGLMMGRFLTWLEEGS